MNLGRWNWLLDSDRTLEKSAAMVGPEWDSQLDRDIEILKQAGECGLNLGMTRRAFAYLGRIHADSDTFNKVAAAAIDTDMMVAAEQLRGDDEELAKEASGALARVGLELVKLAGKMGALGELARFGSSASKAERAIAGAAKELEMAKKLPKGLQRTKSLASAERKLRTHNESLYHTNEMDRGLAAAKKKARPPAPQQPSSAARLQEPAPAPKRAPVAAPPLQSGKTIGDLKIEEMKASRPAPAPASAPTTASTTLGTTGKAAPHLEAEAKARETASRQRSGGRTGKNDDRPISDSGFGEGGYAAAPPRSAPTPRPPPSRTAPPGAPPPSRTAPPGTPPPPVGPDAGIMGSVSKWNKEGWSALSSGERKKLIAAGVATAAGTRILSGRDVLTGDKGGGGSGRRVIVA